MRLMKLLTISMLLLISISCTKTRNPKLPDQVEFSLFNIKELESMDFKLKLTQPEFITKTLKPNADGGKKKYQAFDENIQKIVSSHNASAKTEFLFRNLELRQSAEDLLVKVKLSKNYLTAFRVIEDISKRANISKLDRLLAKKVDHQFWIPLFKFKIDDYGTIERSLNSAGKKTLILELRKSDWTLATHVMMDPRPDNRMMIDLASQPYEQLQDIYSSDRINNRIFTRQELQHFFSFDFTMLAPYPLDTPFLVRINGTQLQIKLMSASSSTWLTDVEKKNLNQFESCNSKSVQEVNIGHAPLPIDCILLDRGAINISYTKPKLKLTPDNIDYTNEIEFEQASSTIESNFIKIEKNQIVTPQELLQEFSDLIALKNIEKTEFLFRRTIEDASNSLIVAPGSSGSTEVVKFTFDKDKLSIRRVEAILSSTFTHEIDTEELMTFPVKYYQITKRDNKGALLSTPKLVNTDRKNAEFVKIDLQHNKIPISSSPLMYLEGGVCFSSVNNTEIKDKDIDNELNKGRLNFSYSYSVSLIPECINSYPTVSDYFDSTYQQMTHNVKERISLVKYMPHSTPNYKIPFYAQRRLKFGAFTIANRKYDQYGNYGKDGTEEATPLQFDVSNGKKIVYTLGGVSAQNPRRELIITAVNDVIQDWNIAFRKALEGSSLARTDDIIELKIDGIDSEPGHLGDLNKNYIWIVEKKFESAPSGVAQPAVDPRTGYVESANIILFDAEFVTSAGYRTENQNKFENFDKRVEKLFLKKKAELDSESQAAISEIEDPSASKKSTISLDINVENTNNSTKFNLSSKPLAEKLKSKEFNLVFNNDLNSAYESASANSLLNTNRSARIDLNQIANSKSFIPYAETAWDKLTNKNIISDIYNKINKENSWQNDDAIEIIANEAFFNHNKKAMSTEQKNKLSKTIVKMKLRSNLKQNILSSGPACATSFPDEFLNISTITNHEEFYSNSYKLIFSHELGHSLGLTHNFIASTDKVNSEDKDYSSVMDYLDGSKVLYKGIGKYDIHALMAIYTQRIENLNGHLIMLEEILKNTKVKSWTAFMSLPDEKITELKLKPYQYCSDADLKTDLKCKQHDFGTTATEIIQNNIRETMRTYQLINGTNDRLDYNWLNSGRYIKLVIQSLRPFRQVLNDYIGSVLDGGDGSGSSEAITADYKNASNLAYMYLLSILGTPSTDLPFESEERISITSTKITPEQYKEMDPKFTHMTKELVKKDDRYSLVETPVSLHLVESKSMKDQFVSSTDFRLNTRGYSYDKAFALMFLISRKSLESHFRPAQESAIEFSFIEFEKYGNIKEPKIIDSLVAMIKGEQKTTSFDFHGGLISITDDYSTKSSPLTTSTALDLAIFGLAPSTADLLTVINNYLFRVGVREGSHPAGMLSINRLEEEKNSHSGYHYYQTDGATHSNEFIKDLYIKRELLEAPQDILEIVAGGAKLILDLAIDFDDKGLLHASLFKEKLVELQLKFPSNKKVSSAIQYFDNKTEIYKRFLTDIQANPKHIAIARPNLESLSSNTAQEIYGILEQIISVKEIKSQIDNLSNTPESQNKKEELQNKITQIEEKIKVSQDLTIKFEIKISYLILARKAVGLILTNNFDLDRTAAAIQSYHLHLLYLQAGADIWAADFRKQHPTVTDAEVKIALQKSDENSLSETGKTTIDQKIVTDFLASQTEVKENSLKDFTDMELEFTQDMKIFKTHWLGQFKKIQQLSNYYQLYTIEAQK